MSPRSSIERKGTMPKADAAISLSLQLHAISGAFRRSFSEVVFASTYLMSEPFDDAPKNRFGQ